MTTGRASGTTSRALTERRELGDKKLALHRLPV